MHTPILEIHICKKIGIESWQPTIMSVLHIDGPNMNTFSSNTITTYVYHEWIVDAGIIGKIL